VKQYIALILLLPIYNAHSLSSHKPQKKSIAPLTLSSFFVPVTKSKQVSPVTYTFSGPSENYIKNIRLCFATDNTCGTCNTGFTFITTGTPIHYTTTGITYGIPMNSIAAYLVSKGISSTGNFNVGMYVQSENTDINCSNTYCSTYTDTTTPTPNVLCMQAVFDGDTFTVTSLTQSDNGHADLNAPAPATQLESSINILGLSVLGTGALTGNARIITITNVGAADATNVDYTIAPALPGGTPPTTISPATCATITPGNSCVLTITPGTFSSESNPSIISISSTDSNNTNILNPNINVLTYGDIFQSGYVYSVNDTTANTGSIGGNVAALADSTSSIVWDSSANCNSVSNACILTPAGSSSDGQENTFYIYSTLTTTSLLPPNSYAAGLCYQVNIDGYYDWYLPAICEMGYDADNNGSGCGTQTSPTIAQNMQTNLVDINNTSLLAGTYWSSTQSNPIPNSAWTQFFQLPGLSIQTSNNKYNPYAVRCVRALTKY